jgi:hypothetical protein
LLAACGDGGGSTTPVETGGVGGGGFTASGGAAAGGALTSAGGAAVGSGGTVTGAGGAAPGAGGASAATGGAPAAVPAGQLACGGKTCHAGGHCAKDGSCPAFLGDCFSQVDHFDTCNAYCAAKGFACAAKSCYPDGTSVDGDGGYSWVGFPAARKAECGVSAAAPQSNFDACTSPIWLSPSKAADDVIRCCCRG